MTNEKRILMKALELITPPGGWIRGQFKRKNSRYGCYGYCASGAIEEAAKLTRRSGFTSNARCLLEEQVFAAKGYRSIVQFNDNTLQKKADVLALFKKVIAKLA